MWILPLILPAHLLYNYLRISALSKQSNAAKNARITYILLELPFILSIIKACHKQDASGQA